MEIYRKWQAIDQDKRLREKVGDFDSGNWAAWQPETAIKQTRGNAKWKKLIGGTFVLKIQTMAHS